MATTKSKAKKGKRPPKVFDEKVSVAAGLKKAPASSSDVAGHGAWPGNYICWRCGAINFVPGGIYAFYCWRDWAYNLAP